MSTESGTALVGVISDTHGRLPDAAFAALSYCDHIIHAGDIGDPQILRTLAGVAPVYAVLGNNDAYKYPDDVRLIINPVIEGVRFLVAHYPRDVRIGSSAELGIRSGNLIPQVCIHGHTHFPKLLVGKEAYPAQYLICPGSVTRPRQDSKPSVAKIALANGTVEKAWIEPI
ncbi:MAG: metallophosphatase family protein [Eggerthellaceae bacterium]|jgi:putative phosphoesterase|nr:metallophosphatase family protein [Eggerthellaceae bacterium]MDR2721435.1 metallophosphatase family protein [Coriobacteriaceae bacterium]